jgi:hypothetical protein
MAVLAENHGLIVVASSCETQRSGDRRVHCANHICQFGSASSLGYSATAFINQRPRGIELLDESARVPQILPRPASSPSDPKMMEAWLPFDHASNARNARLPPPKIVCETTHRLHAVRLDVCFVPDVQAIPVCQSIEGRVGRIMARTNQIEVVLSGKTPRKKSAVRQV